MTQHSPGPWELNTQDTGMNDSGTILGAGTVIIPDIYGRSKGEADANARLIAAAPEMKDLLLHALHYIETPGDFTETERLELCQDIDDLIAKAEGRG